MQVQPAGWLVTALREKVRVAGLASAGLGLLVMTAGDGSLGSLAIQGSGVGTGMGPTDKLAWATGHHFQGCQTRWSGNTGLRLW